MAIDWSGEVRVAGCRSDELPKTKDVVAPVEVSGSRSTIAACGVLALLFASGCTTLSELRNPTVLIPVDHPPGIGIALTKVVFAPPEGNCSAQLANAATRELLVADVEVGGDLTVVATPGTAGTEGVSGADVPGGILLSLSDTACEGERSSSSRHATRKRTKAREVDGEEEEYEEEYTVTYHTRTARFDVGVSVRASDLRTGEVVAAWEIRHASSDSNTEVDDVPEYPSESRLKRSALHEAGIELGQWLLPWTEKLALIFYDADECGMAATYAHFEAGDMAPAAAAARQSIDDCTTMKAEPRFRAAGYYNAGLLHFFGGRHGAALEMFDTAGTLDPENGKIALASAETSRAKASLDEILRIEALATAASVPDPVLESVSRKALPEAGGRLDVFDASDGKDSPTGGDRFLDFGLDAANANPQGVTHAAGRVYVADDRSRRVYAYTMEGRRDPEADFDLNDQKVPTGVTHVDGRLYVVDWSDDRVYAYATDGRRDPDADFDLVRANGSPTGIAHADGRLYVVDSSDDKVYVYTTAGGPDPDFDLDPANPSPAGIAHAGDRLYVVDDVKGVSKMIVEETHR